MYSLLKETDKFIKETGIVLTKMDFGYECLPDYINQAILYAVREMDGTNEFSLGVDTYYLNYNHQGNLYIQTVTDSTQRKLLIFSNEYDADIVPGTKAVSERRILEYAYLLQKNRLKQLEIRDLISIKYPNKSRLERLKLEYKIMYRIINDELTKSYQDGEDILAGIDLESWLKDSFEKITATITEENNSYLERKRREQELMYESRSDEGTKRIPGNGVKSIRVNDIIPADKRQQILQSHKCMFSVNASPYNTEDTGYFCYLYRVGTGVYMLILEPKSGISYTKLIGVYDKWFLSDQEFQDFVKDYLEMTPQEMLECDNVVRTNHTTLDVFEDNIRYAVTGESQGLINPYAKKRIKEIRNHPNKRG